MIQYDTPINGNDATFEQVVLQTQIPVVAVFWSPQVPRQQLDAVLEQTAQEYAGQALVVKLDVGDAPQAQARYGIDSLPQFLFFRQGTLVARARGMPTAEMLRPWVEYLLERGPKPATRKPPAGDSRPLVVTDADFEQLVLKAQAPVLVRVLFAKLDVDANQMTAQRYGVQSIPTLIIFRDGQPVERIVGVQPVHALRQKLEALL